MSESEASGGLRRDLGPLQAYAALLGILIGAGIFKVTGQAWQLTGPSVILAYLVLAPPVLATSVAYAVFLSTPLGREPGGEYTHIARTFGGHRIAFVGAWLKVISYLGALAYLAAALADYVIEIAAGSLDASARTPLALLGLLLFYVVHAAGVRWFGRLQVIMCAFLGVSLLILIAPGLLAIRPENYRPFFTRGAVGFAAALPPLFFAYAGFESLAQAAGEMKDSTSRLPGIFVKGILATALIFLSISAVALGVIPGERLAASPAPMAEAAASYLPAGAAWVVGLGAVMAIATSVNATMLVPSRLAIILARDGLAPRALAALHPATGTPVVGLTITLALASALVATGQIDLALNVSVLALVSLYLLHSLALIVLPARNPHLFSQVRAPIPRWLQVGAGLLSAASMGCLILVQVTQDSSTILGLGWRGRTAGTLTSLELVSAWGVIGLAVHWLGRRRSRPGRENCTNHH